MTLTEFFKDQVTNPQAKNIGTGYVPFVSFMVSNDICKLHEDEVKKLAAQYKLTSFKSGGFTVFQGRK